MRGYEGWSLTDRPFLWAILVSLLWHFFWFFSVSIVVTPEARKKSDRPRIVALGPVLDDTIFRTLVETKPQFSPTFYRRLSDFAGVMDVEVKMVERRAAGDVVSLPFGKKFTSSLRASLGGHKVSPPEEFASRIPIGYGSEDEEKDHP